ncbi:MAG: hypothetical protein LC800_03360 [Acidobacteria bacterium]|nr:hypothetical protein [Acidobacteriota bacterium]
MRKIMTTTLSACLLLAACAPAAAAQERRGARPIRHEPFEVEVLVDGAPLEKYPGRGRLYVEAVRGEEYSIRIRNPLPVRVAVALSVDGLNSIDARRTSARDASKWVIQPHGTITVGGWQVSADRARRFYFTTEADSYANKLGRPEDTGVISAVFFRERASYSEVTPRPRPRPLESSREDGAARKDESRGTSGPTPQPSTRGAGAARAQSSEAAPAPDDDYAATGMGRSVGHDVRWVNLDLENSPSSEVTIRYEYRPALVRLGILPRPAQGRDPLRRRERARGFEDGRFSPEP